MVFGLTSTGGVTHGGIVLIIAVVVLGGISPVMGLSGLASADVTTSGLSPPPEQWNRTYGGTSSEFVWSVIETDDAGYLFAGYTPSYGAGGADAWLVKVDSNGDEVWNRTYGGSSYEEAYSVIETTDGGYLFAGVNVSSTTRADAWLVKVDDTGVEQWSETYGGPDADGAFSVVETADGGYLFAGQTSSSGSSDAWLVKVNDAGVEQWNETFGGSAYDFAASVISTADGGSLVVGETNSFGADRTDGWLIKVDSTGAEQWNQTYGGSGLDYGRSVIETDDAGYLFAGFTNSFGGGYGDAWLVKVNASGAEQWTQTYGGEVSDRAFALIETDGGYLLLGDTSSFGAGRTDAWLVNVDATGAEQWNQTYGGTSFDYAVGLLGTSDGGYLLGGATFSFSLGGQLDAWLVKLGETTGGVTVEVDIDIKPGSDQNPINPRAGGVIPVAILNTSSFDPTAVNVSTLAFGDPDDLGGGGATPSHDGHFEDVDGDGDLDLVVHFPTQDTGFDRDDTAGHLVGELRDGTPIEGADSVRTVPR